MVLKKTNRTMLQYGIDHSTAMKIACLTTKDDLAQIRHYSSFQTSWR